MKRVSAREVFSNENAAESLPGEKNSAFVEGEGAKLVVEFPSMRNQSREI